MATWQPIATADKEQVIIAGEWKPDDKGMMAWHYFISWWAKDHWIGHPTHWAMGVVLPVPPPKP